MLELVVRGVLDVLEIFVTGDSELETNSYR
jgi:hypothetical protein